MNDGPASPPEARCDVREARAEDWPSLHRIHAAATRSSYGQTLPWLIPILEDPETPLEDAAWTLVAEAAGRVVGYVAVTGSHVENLFVDPEAQGKGVGDALLRAAEARVQRERGAEGEREARVTLRCLLVNERARRFYERQGYSARETHEVVLHGRPLPAWFMVKELLLLLLLFGVAGCALEEVVSDRPTSAPSAPPATTETTETTETTAPSTSSSLSEDDPMPGPHRGRLGAAVALNATCESCHHAEAAEWRRSLHRQSNTNAAYRAAFAVEPSSFCRGCHAPEADPNPTKTPPRAVSELGVGCVTCHVTEEGFVLAAPSSRGDAPHPLRRSVEFARAGACTGCHEFRFPGALGGDDDDGYFMQTTAREHQRSPGADRACADCHMPLLEGRRSHAFAEVRDPAWLRENLTASASLSDDNRVRVTLTQRDPGHAFPTGDLFRRLEVGLEVRDKGGKVIERETRHLARHFELVPGRSGRLLVRDDRVFAEPSVIEIALSPAPPERRPAVISWWVSLQRVATVGTGQNPEGAKIESTVRLHSGVLPWESR
jgi:ribosomal protein S18 acetylase RimI-like enzyme